MQTHADDAHTVAVGHIDLKGVIVLGSHLHIETDIGLGLSLKDTDSAGVVVAV